MYTRKLKRGGRPPLWAGPAAYLPKMAPRSPFTPLPQAKATPVNTKTNKSVKTGKNSKNSKKETRHNTNNNSNYGNVWPVNTSKWNTPVGNRNAPVNVYATFNKAATVQTGPTNYSTT